MVDAPTNRPPPRPLNRDRRRELPARIRAADADDVYAALSTVKPDDAAVVMESTSTMAELIHWLPTDPSAASSPPAAEASVGVSRGRWASRWATGPAG